ncbi:serine protease 1 [Drosophila busckii]|uniref:serine protease 1 n=1 Tax=Drosophila busckii TaxID=30019 RepID=UPI0014333B4D|nr:serine protease 1 [Drosophila busckii]
MKLLLLVCSVAFVAASGNDNDTYHLSEQEQPQPENIITNGYPAYEGKAPYIVGLMIGRDNSNVRSVCGGSIIAHTWVLTARHCLTSADYADIHYGSNRGWQGQFYHKVRKQHFILHHNEQNDVAVIRTPYVDFTSLVNKVQLPKLSQRNERFVNWWAVACGWGGMANGKLADWLQCIDIQIISNEECARTYGSLPNQVLCTRTTGGTATCGGDSGGPLVTHDNPILVGITAFGVSGACDAGNPDGYMRVTHYLDWIREKTGVFY